jgi:hypothetical protein
VTVTASGRRVHQLLLLQKDHRLDAPESENNRCKNHKPWCGAKTKLHFPCVCVGGGGGSGAEDYVGPLYSPCELSQGGQGGGDFYFTTNGGRGGGRT